MILKFLGLKKCENLVEEVGENYQFKFTGIKEIKTETTEKQQYYSNIIVGEFKLIFYLKISEFSLKNKEDGEFEYENGLLTATFDLNKQKPKDKKIVFWKENKRRNIKIKIL